MTRLASTFLDTPTPAADSSRTTRRCFVAAWPTILAIDTSYWSSNRIREDRADLRPNLNHTNDFVVDIALSALIDDMRAGKSLDSPSAPLHISSLTDGANRTYAIAR